MDYGQHIERDLDLFGEMEENGTVVREMMDQLRFLCSRVQMAVVIVTA